MKKKIKSLLWSVVFVVIVILLISKGVNYKAKQNKNNVKEYNFDTSAEIGALQQEIYDGYGIAVLYNVDVKEALSKKITNVDDFLSDNENYNITDTELLLEKMLIIEDCLKFFSKDTLKKLVPEIYIINNFSLDDTQNGLTFNAERKAFAIVYRLDRIDKHAVYHELSHALYHNDEALEPDLFNGISNTMCSTVSSYACTNETELFAEVLSFALSGEKETVYTKKISKYVESITN